VLRIGAAFSVVVTVFYAVERNVDELMNRAGLPL
jgi:hypothetical protein